jgi:hypothetical protein
MNWDKIIQKIIMKQFDIIGVEVKFDELKSMQDWYLQWEMNEKQHEEWKAFTIDVLRKEGKMPKYKALKQFAFIDMNWGLKLNLVN